MNPHQIRHMVVFNLHYEPDAPETAAFLRDGQRILSAIPGVREFEVCREISPKNGYNFGFSMLFDDRAAYDAYTAHPEHCAFVAQRWDVEVQDFMEIDLEVLTEPWPVSGAGFLPAGQEMA